MTANHPLHDYGPALPAYAMEKQAIIPLVAAGGLALKALMAAWAAKGVYDIGTKDLPGLVKNIGQGNWRGALGNVGSGAVNALMAVPGVGALGRGMTAASRGGKFFRGVTSGANVAGKTHRLGGAVGRGFEGANRAMGSFMGTGLGQRLLPAAERANAMFRGGPRWLFRPQGLMDTGKYMGAQVGASMVGGLAAGQQPEFEAQQFAYPFAQQPGLFSQLSRYVKNMPPTPPAQYML